MVRNNVNNYKISTIEVENEKIEKILETVKIVPTARATKD